MIGPSHWSAGEDREHPNSLRSRRKAHIERVMRITNFDMDKAATLLEITVPNLRAWMTRLGIPDPTRERKPDK